MPYYTGDYYRGDYYRGDPGLFSFIGKAARGLVGAIVPGGNVINALASSVLTKRPAAINAPGATMFAGPQTGLINIGSGRQTGLLNFGTGGPPPYVGAMPGGMPVLRGYHLNRSTYETRGGGTSRWGGAGSLQIHPKGTVLVRNRHRNVGNARALRHALGRVAGFARLARRVMTFTHPRAGRGHFKFRRKKK